MFSLSVPKSKPERQRMLKWTGPFPIFEEMSQRLMKVGYDLKTPKYGPRDVIVFIWIPTHNPSDLTFSKLEKAIRTIVQEQEGIYKSRSDITVNQWADQFMSWVHRIQSVTEITKSVPLFEIDQMIVRRDYSRADKLLEAVKLQENDSRRKRDILRSQMFLMHRQQYDSRVWEIYSEWILISKESPDPRLAYWVAKGAYSTKHYEQAFEIVKEIRNHTWEVFHPEEQIDIQLLQLELLERIEEYTEVLLLAGSMYQIEGVSTKQQKRIEDAARDAIECILDQGDPVIALVHSLPENLREMIVEEFELSLVVPEEPVVKMEELEELLHQWELHYRTKPREEINRLRMSGLSHPNIALAIGRTYSEVLHEHVSAKEVVEGITLEHLLEEDRYALAKILFQYACYVDSLEDGVYWGEYCLKHYYDPEICADYGQLLLKTSEPKAFELLSLAVEKGVRNAHVYMSLGILYFQKDDFTAAAEKFKEALRLDPLQEEALDWLFGVETDESVKLAAAECFIQSLKSDYWNGDYKAKYETRLQLAKQLDQGGLKAVEAYQDLFEFYLRQEKVNLQAVDQLLEDAVREVQDIEALLDLFTTTEVVFKPELDECLIHAYHSFVYRCFRKESDWVYIPKILKRIVLLGEIDFVQEIREELNNKMRALENKHVELAIEDSENEIIADLSHLKVTIISGYEQVRKRIKEKLLEKFSINNVREVPPAFEARTDADIVEDQIKQADIILFMYRCSKHSDYNQLEKALNNRDDKALVYVGGKGHSSALTAFENYAISEGLL